MNWFVAKVRYVFERAGKISPDRIMTFAKQAQRVSPRTPLVFIIPDMFYSVVRYQSTFEHYAQWDYLLLKAKERKTFMTEPKSSMVSEAYNSKAHRHLFDDKVEFNKTFADEVGRDWLDVKNATVEELAAFLKKHPRIMTKNPLGVGGDSLAAYTSSEVADVAALRQELIDSGRTLAEQFIEQHPEMARLYPGSINTMRIVTYLDANDKVHVLARVLKIGNGGFIDNYSNGGMYTMTDESGRALHAAYDGNGDIYTIHPASGVTIEGFQVPLFDEVLAFADTLARKVPEMPYIGWDIAITPEGPVVIEGNHNSGVFQSRPAVNGVKTGLLPLYREVMNF